MNFKYFSDETGRIVVWDLFELNQVAKLEINEEIMCIDCCEESLFIQTKNGKILLYTFLNNSFALQQTIQCGIYTFCRISAKNGLLAFPSANVENAVSVIDYRTGHRVLADFFADSKNGILWGVLCLVNFSGMCMFTKIQNDVLICGYESGAVCVRALNGDTFSNERILEESCNDAIIQEGNLYVLGAADKITCRHPNGTIISTQVPFPGFSSIAALESFIVTGGWDAK